MFTWRHHSVERSTNMMMIAALITLFWILPIPAQAQTDAGVNAPPKVAVDSPGNSRITGRALPGLNKPRDAMKAEAVWQKAGADEGLRQAFERATYTLEDSGHGTWR